MARLTPIQLLVANLRGEFLKGQREYRSPAEAHSKLKHLTGEDFGLNADRWSRWIEANPDIKGSTSDSEAFAERLFPPSEDIGEES